MAINPNDYAGYQRAIDAALLKERIAKDPTYDPTKPLITLTYAAVCTIAGKVRRITSTDLQAFITTVTKFQKHYPNVKLTLLEITTEV